MSADRPRAEIRDAGSGDREAVAMMLARAFADDPAMCFIFPDPAERARRLPRLFALLFDTDGPPGMRLTTDACQAATMWRPPGQADTSLWDLLRRAPAVLHALGGAALRALRVSAAVDAHHPETPFWYLHIAGCDPVYQGQGLGGALIRHGLSITARDGVPCYLETPLEKNVGLYRSLGFELIGDWAVPGGGPRFWSMQRPT